MSITLNDIAQPIQGEIPCSKRDIFRAVNRVLRDINSKLNGGILHSEVGLTTHGVMDSLALTFNSGAKTITRGSGSFITDGFVAGDTLWVIGMADAANIVELTIAAGGVATLVLTVTNTIVTEGPTACTAFSYVKTTGYGYDPNTCLLTLPDKCKQLLEVFENDDELENQTFEYVTDTSNDSEKVFHTYSHSQLLLPTWLMDASNDELTVKMLRDLAAITSDDSTTTIDVPQQMKQALINGCLFYLYAINQYKNPDQMKTNSELYFKQLEEINLATNSRFPSTQRTRKYNY
jgi:hypothetical protein